MHRSCKYAGSFEAQRTQNDRNDENIGLIDKDRYGEIFFTQEGQELAEKYSSYYDSFSNSLWRIAPAETDIMSGICAFFAEFSTDEIEKMHNNLLSV